ncbi:Uncharacterised protein [Mycobacteroides abscessus subsp. abscessus]|nr:Uncharacterised protein [Mycobacteroides abscessus subsp. abscessus]
MPLSQISTTLPSERAVPDGGSGRCAVTCSVPCRILARSISIPGKDTLGGSTAWKPEATVAKVGSTCGVLSCR